MSEYEHVEIGCTLEYSDIALLDHVTVLENNQNDTRKINKNKHKSINAP